MLFDGLIDSDRTVWGPDSIEEHFYQLLFFGSRQFHEVLAGWYTHPTRSFSQYAIADLPVMLLVA